MRKAALAAALFCAAASVANTAPAQKPEDFAKFVRGQMGIFRKIAQDANIQPQ